MSVVLSPDAIRATDSPTFLRGEAAAAQMTADEPVLGLRLGGEPFQALVSEDGGWRMEDRETGTAGTR